MELEWRGRAQGDELRTGTSKGIQFAQHQIRTWIANMTNMLVISPEDQAWLKAKWLPQLRLLGIEFLAIVISTDALSRLSVHNSMCESEQDGQAPFETVYFTSVQDARNWVRQAYSLPWVARRH
ncbi:hypothetical protein [Hymenobacter volaticus]|uniref:STAS/SEC14 domain-containing protein n=1 Tax=Hymenobacter volaticus TaxID=2932254 RepID=A0ABY4G445_9BACT|nr:hypothetical protein [Hymenobacter volaticus]UOQ65555.1 hypothetical protein MUN86_18735 [Hymenobacter volaticus]